MAFGVNYDEAGKGLIPEGTFETIIDGAAEGATPNGNPCINIPLVIRNDIEQPYKNAIIWHRLLKKNTPTAEDMACDGYSSKQIQSMSKAAALPNGQQFNSIADWCKALNGNAVAAVVYHEEYNGKKSARVRYVNEPKNRDIKHVFKPKSEPTTQQTYGDMAPLNEKALPF